MVRPSYRLKNGRAGVCLRTAVEWRVSLNFLDREHKELKFKLTHCRPTIGLPRSHLINMLCQGTASAVPKNGRQ